MTSNGLEFPGVRPEAQDLAAIPEAAASSLAGLFRQHHGELVRLAAMLVRSREAAEDIVQDVFTNIHARYGELVRPGEALPYLRAAVLNRCRSALRRREVSRRLGRGRDLTADLPHASAEADAIRAEDRREVLAALAALPVRRREVLVLRYYLGLSESEIARTLGITPGTVKSTAARGLAALAHMLGEQS